MPSAIQSDRAIYKQTDEGSRIKTDQNEKNGSFRSGEFNPKELSEDDFDQEMLSMDGLNSTDERNINPIKQEEPAG